MVPQNEFDDPAFISLVGTFVRTYIEQTSASRVHMIHIDNWFGERWLGFAGKFRGIAGIRQRHGKLGNDIRRRSLAVPPFRPTRVQDYAAFMIESEGSMKAVQPRRLHYEKNGGWIQTLFGDGLFVWYSGRTACNTSGSLMAYELNADGQDAWFLNFATNRSGDWDVVSCRNTQISVCRAISAKHYMSVAARAV